MIAWIRREKALARLREELAEERATIAVIHCARERECQAEIDALRAQVDALMKAAGMGQSDAPNLLAPMNDDLADGKA